ncbi:MAG: sugar ABC transporter permease [Chloroflexia bacterium]|nr:sugar ABC transporter permease [Chloroflexia bacterium]
MAVARDINREQSASVSRRRFGARGSLARREAIWGFALISPWVIGLLIFWVGPLLAAFYYSFTEFPILSAPTWIGLENYRQIFTTDPEFLISLGNTAYYVLIRVPLHLGIALGLAMLLNRATRGIGIFRTLIYLPSMVPVVALAVAWRVLLDPRTGYVNYVAEIFNLPRINYLTSAAWIKPVIIGISLWQVGIAMIVFIAGLASVPDHLYEAAKIDGANAWQRFCHVTIPMLTPVMLYNVVIDIIASFQVFAYAFIFSDGGPRNASLFYVLYIYKQAFEFFRMGYASALAMILFLIILVFTVILMRSSDRWVHYERI